MGWVREQVARVGLDDSVVIADVTSARAVINLCGPRSRAVLQAACEEDVSNQAFRRSRARELTIGSAPVLALRVGYVGELGWELHVPTEYGAHVYETLRAAGEPHGIVDVGYRAIDTMRMEKGYLYWSTDITPDSSPFEAGLDWRVDLDAGDFCGREALLAQQATGVGRRLCTFTIDGEAYPVGGEAILADGEVVGFTTSANFGHTVGAPICYGYLPRALAETRTRFEIEVYGEVHPALRHDRALHDPEDARLRS
jgi:4-methylaminobutanoate oxidase (formaldehyde-forming)